MLMSFSERYRLIAKRWVEADAAATLLEETKSAVFSRMVQKYLSMDWPVSRAEHEVKASNDWHDFVTTMVNKRKDADLLKVQLEYIKMQYWENNSKEATERAEMRL